MYARATLGEEEPRAMLVLPAAAIQEIYGKPHVFVAGGGGIFERRLIAIGAADAGLVEVRSGIQAGEKVAREGSFALKSELLKASAKGGD
jgi:hypothetical protein